MFYFYLIRIARTPLLQIAIEMLETAKHSVTCFPFFH